MFFVYISQIGDFVKLHSNHADLFQIMAFEWREGDYGPIRRWQRTHKQARKNKKAIKDRPAKRTKLMLRIGKAKIAALAMVPPTKSELNDAKNRHQCITEALVVLDGKVTDTIDRVSLALINQDRATLMKEKRKLPKRLTQNATGYEKCYRDGNSFVRSYIYDTYYF
jgi:hypothetical protein